MTAHGDSSVPLSTRAPAGRAAGTATMTTALILTLALQSAVPPFATDMYTPAFPRVTADQRHLGGVGRSDVDHVLPFWFLVGFGC
jgi:hypothetical protein